MVSVGRGNLGQSASYHEKGGVALTQALKVFPHAWAGGRDGGTNVWGTENPQFVSPLLTLNCLPWLLICHR